MLANPDPARPNHRPRTVRAVDVIAVADATRALLLALGEDPDRPALADTPRRIAESWRDFLETAPTPIRPLPASVPAADDVVLVKDIDFVSVCEHHLLPFAGVAHVAYQPHEILLGLSDIPRIVHRASSRLHLQENLTAEIADILVDETECAGVLVVVEARHGCVSDRGIRQSGVRTITMTTHGTLNNPERRDGLFALLRRSTT